MVEGLLEHDREFDRIGAATARATGSDLRALTARATELEHRA